MIAQRRGIVAARRRIVVPFTDQVLATPNLFRYFRLGDSSGTTAVEEVAAANGTYVGSPTLGATGLQVGDADTAVTFDGSTEHCSLGTLGSVGSGMLSTGATFLFLIQTTTTATVKAVYGLLQGSSTGLSIHCALNALANNTGSVGNTNFTFQLNSTNRMRASPTIPVNIYDGNPHVIGVSPLTATTMAVYIDGVGRGMSYSNQGTGFSTPADFTQALFIGARNNLGTADLHAVCTLDEFAVFTRVLDAGEHAALAAAAL